MSGEPKNTNPFQAWLEEGRAARMLGNSHYPAFFTTHFGLMPEYYAGKRILDVGCGPRGSLEWADMARERIGLDPLSDTYLALGADRHKMTYVKGFVENAPFQDGYFDVVSAFYSFDQVARLGTHLMEALFAPVLSGMARVLKREGVLLVLTELDHGSVEGQWSPFASRVTQMFGRYFEVDIERHYEKTGHGIFDSLEQNIPFDDDDCSQRFGILSLKAHKAS